MEYINIGKYPIDIRGVGVVKPGETFECDRHRWDRQSNIAPASAKDASRVKPKKEDLLAVESISELRDLVEPWKIKGRSKSAILKQAFEAFGYGEVPEAEEG